jgi:hypothetical protein
MRLAVRDERRFWQSILRLESIGTVHHRDDDSLASVLIDILIVCPTIFGWGRYDCCSNGSIVANMIPFDHSPKKKKSIIGVLTL